VALAAEQPNTVLSPNVDNSVVLDPLLDLGALFFRHCFRHLDTGVVLVGSQ